MKNIKAQYNRITLNKTNEKVEILIGLISMLVFWFLSKNRTLSCFLLTHSLKHDTIIYVKIFIYHIMRIMWCFSFLSTSASQKPQFLNLPAVYLARFHCVNSCCVYAAVPENISQAYDVLLQAVIRAREKMTKVVWKDLLFRHVRRLTQFFHITPDYVSYPHKYRRSNSNGTVESTPVTKVP